ncbi:MAG TPA: hypothetical protein VGR91_04310 [Stellaceae bacterium]|nr:hypothetical protein [Stellaceae bacterium]
MIEGALESLDKEQLHGWALSADDRDDRLLVEVFVRGRLRASQWADEARANAAGPGSGHAGHRFLIGFTRPLTDDDLPQVEVYATTKSGERVRLGPGGVHRDSGEGLSAGLGPAGGLAASAGEPRHWPFPAPQVSAAPSGELRLEIAAQIERLGLRHFSAGGWVGSRGTPFPIRGLAVRAVGPRPPTAVEIKGFFSGGESAWIGGGAFSAPEAGAGPLTGFAVRAADPRWEALYYGRFAAGGEIGPCRDGAPCASTRPDDPLTAIRVEIRQRAPQS